MYGNLMLAMKIKGVTAIQLSNLLNCRQATVSEKLNGVVKCGFYFDFDEAVKIKKVLFPEYDYEYLFSRKTDEKEENE